MPKKAETTINCVAEKRRAQRSLAKALAGQSPEDQVKALRRLAAQAPLWQELSKASGAGVG